MKPWTRLDRYLTGQLFGTMLFAVLLFTIIWLAPDTLFRLTQNVFADKLNAGQAFVMFLYHIPGVLQQTIPVAVLLGAIVLFQRLSQNYELVAMLASGISPARVLFPVLVVGVLFAILQVAVTELVIPQTAPRLEKAYADLDLKDVPDRNFLFVEKDHQDRLAKFFMIGQIHARPLRDFIVLYYEDGGDTGVRISRILRARSGEWLEQPRQWKLVNGIEYVLNEEGVYKDIRPFTSQQVRTDQYAKILLDYSQLNPLSMPFPQLRKYIKLMKEGGQLQDVPYFEVRLWQKFSGPVATIIFALLGAMLGMERIRTNRTYGLTFGALVIFIYSILVPFTGNLGGLSAPWLAAWAPLVMTSALAGGMLALRPKS